MPKLYLSLLVCLILNLLIIKSAAGQNTPFFSGGAELIAETKKPPEFHPNDENGSLNDCQLYSKNIKSLVRYQNFPDSDKHQITAMVDAYASDQVPEQAYPVGRYFHDHKVYASHHNIIVSTKKSSGYSAIPPNDKEGQFWTALSLWQITLCNISFLVDQSSARYILTLIKSLNQHHLISPPYIEIGAGRGLLSQYIRKNGVDIIATDPFVDNYDASRVERLDLSQALRRYNNSNFFICAQPGTYIVEYFYLFHFAANRINRPVLLLIISDQISEADLIKYLLAQDSIDTVMTYQLLDNWPLKPSRAFKMEAAIFIIIPGSCIDSICNKLRNNPSGFASFLPPEAGYGKISDEL